MGRAADVFIITISPVWIINTSRSLLFKWWNEGCIHTLLVFISLAGFVRVSVFRVSAASEERRDAFPSGNTHDRKATSAAREQMSNAEPLRHRGVERTGAQTVPINSQSNKRTL